MTDQSPVERPARRTVSRSYEDPTRPVLCGLAVILIFCLLAVAWGVHAPVSGAVVADGSLQVEGRRQSVQHPYGGVIRSLNVREGQTVRRGQILMTLSDSEPKAQRDVLASEQSALVAQEARLVAERDGKQHPTFPAWLLARRHEPDVAQVLDNEAAMILVRRHQHETQRGMLRQRLAQLHEQIRGTQAQVDGLNRQRALLEEEAKGARSLLSSGLTPRTRVLALDRDAAKLQAELGARLSDQARAKEVIGETEMQIVNLDRTRLTEITNDLRATQKRLVEIRPKLDAARDILARTEVGAPASGAVVGLTVFTEGGVIQPGARLLDIVPTSDALIVDARLKLADISDIGIGMRADVRLLNFTMRERPVIAGEVMTISADRMTDDRSGQGYYSIQVSLRPEDVRAARVELQAGMPAQIVIPTRARTMMDYLIGPLIDEFSGALREK